MKNNKRTTICAIIVLSCLLIGFFVIMIRNKDLKPSIDYYKKDGVIVDNKSIIETPKEELRNSDGIIIKQIVKNTNIPTNAIATKANYEKKYIDTIYDYIEDYYSKPKVEYVNSNNLEEYKEGDLRYDGNKLVYDYLITTDHIIRYELYNLIGIRTILWNKKPNAYNNVIIYFLRYDEEHYNYLYRVVINVINKTINVVLIEKNISSSGIAVINCLEEQCSNDNFSILYNNSYHATDYPFTGEYKIYQLLSKSVPDNYKTQVVKETINGKEHTLRLELKKIIDKEIKDGLKGSSPYLADAIEYQLYFDNIPVDYFKGYYELFDNKDYYIEINERNMSIINSTDGKEYLIVELYDSDIPFGTIEPSKYIINDEGKLIGKISDYYGGGIGKITGEGADIYEEYQHTYYYSNDEIRVLVSDKEDYENDQCEFIEKIITITDDKINVKDGNRLFGSYISGVGVPSWDIKTYD